MSVLAELFRPRKGTGALMDDDEAKRLAADSNPQTRRRLAKRRDVQPEISTTWPRTGCPRCGARSPPTAQRRSRRT